MMIGDVPMVVKALESHSVISARRARMLIKSKVQGRKSKRHNNTSRLFTFDFWHSTF